jgi:hypothetical protein
MTEDEKKEARKRVLEEKSKVSTRISDLSRYIGFGLVAVVYTILSSSAPRVVSIYEHYTNWLLWVAVLGVITIILDYLQYLGGYNAVQQALKNDVGNFEYDDESCWYQLRNGAFFFKQCTAFIGAIILVIVIGASAPHN